MSSMDKEIMKVLLKILTSGMKNLSAENKSKLLEYARNILDKDRQKELEQLIDSLETSEDQNDVFLVRAWIYSK